MTAPEPSWWAQLYDDEGAPRTPDQPAPAEPEWWRPARWLPDDRTRPEAGEEERVHIHLTRTRPGTESIPDAARALLPADPRKAAQLRWLLYNAAAAAAGWWLHLEHFCAQGIAESGRASVQEGVWVGVGLILVASVPELRAHALRGPGRHPFARLIGWALRIPLASAVLALALYGPNAAL